VAEAQRARVQLVAARSRRQTAAHSTADAEQRIADQGRAQSRQFAASPVRLPDDQLAKDLEARRVLAAQAYDRWKESLSHRHAYWATASGYQMSQIFVELWEVTVKAPYPARLDPAERARYVGEIHARVRVHLEKALEGHKMNVELAKAYGVENEWSRASAARAVEVMEILAKDARGEYVAPACPAGEGRGTPDPSKPQFLR
jgi:hypothetical protein